MTTMRELPPDFQLSAGAHHSPDEGMCAIEAVSWVAGEPWSDHPACTSRVIAAFMRTWNDTLPDADRTRLLRPLLPLVIGTNTGPADDERRAYLATDWMVRTVAPALLRAGGLTDRAGELAALPELTSARLARAAQPVIDRARDEGDATRDAGWAAACDAAWAATWTAAGDAGWAAACDAAWAAAGDATWKMKGGYRVKYAAARPAADAVLAQPLRELQQSAVVLVRAMAAVGRPMSGIRCRN